MKTMTMLLPAMAIIASLSACAREPSTNGGAGAVVALSSSPVQGSHPRLAPDASQPLPAALVHKSPTCGCCGLWVDHMRAAGFAVEVRNTDDLNPIKERVGVPYAKGSCHTAEVGGYFIEGHVPADDVKRLLAEQPDAKGLVLPGMPAGSPGMELPDGTTETYMVELVNRDGSLTGFARH